MICLHIALITMDVGAEEIRLCAQTFQNIDSCGRNSIECMAAVHIRSLSS